MIEEKVDGAYWIEAVDETHYCSACGRDALWKWDFDDIWDKPRYLEELTQYCPYCGKIMIGEERYGDC